MSEKESVYEWPQFGHQTLMSGMWPFGKILQSGIGLVIVMSGIWPVMFRTGPGNTSDGWNRVSFEWPYSGQQKVMFRLWAVDTDPVPDIADLVPGIIYPIRNITGPFPDITVYY